MYFQTHRYTDYCNTDYSLNDMNLLRERKRGGIEIWEKDVGHKKILLYWIRKPNTFRSTLQTRDTIRHKAISTHPVIKTRQYNLEMVVICSRYQQFVVSSAHNGIPKKWSVIGSSCVVRSHCPTTVTLALNEVSVPVFETVDIICYLDTYSGFQW